jgi:hypothetical protein
MNFEFHEDMKFIIIGPVIVCKVQVLKTLLTDMESTAS